MVLVLGMREMQGVLEQWQRDAGDLRRRMYWAPTPGSGTVACPMAFGPRLDCGGGGRGAGRDAHTIGRWVAVFGEGGPGAMAFEQSGGSPPAIDGSAADRTEGSGAGVSSKGWPRLGQLELEGGAQICAGTFRGLPKPPAVA